MIVLGITACILALGYPIVFYSFHLHLEKIIMLHMTREWELQERIREPEVEVIPPEIMKAQAKVGSEPVFPEQDGIKDEFDNVGEIDLEGRNEGNEWPLPNPTT